MLKFRDENGVLRFLQRDNDAQPVEVDKIAIEILREFGLLEELDEKTKARLLVKTQGLSQDDIVMFKEKP
jgi:hypothetical protein